MDLLTMKIKAINRKITKKRKNILTKKLINPKRLETGKYLMLIET